jgi:hypothetical protein
MWRFVTAVVACVVGAANAMTATATVSTPGHSNDLPSAHVPPAFDMDGCPSADVAALLFKLLNLSYPGLEAVRMQSLCARMCTCSESSARFCDA